MRLLALCMIFSTYLIHVSYEDILRQFASRSTNKNCVYKFDEINGIIQNLLHYTHCSESVILTDDECDYSEKLQQELSNNFFMVSIVSLQDFNVFDIFEDEFKVLHLFGRVKCFVSIFNGAASNKIFSMIAKYKWLFKPYLWIIFTADIEINSSLPFNSRILNISKKTFKTYLSQVYSVSNYSKNQIIQLAEWNTTCNCFSSIKKFPNYKRLMDGFVLRLAVAKFPPALNITKDEHGVLKFYGYYKEFSDKLFYLLNASFEIIVANDNQFGSKHLNGEWSGMYGLVHKNLADIIAAAKPTLLRYEVGDSSPILYSSQFKLLFRITKEKKWNFKFYINPFDYKLWIVLCAINIFIQVFLNFQFYGFGLQSKLGVKPTNNQFKNCTSEIDISSTWPIVMFEAEVKPNLSASRKIVIITYLFFCVITFTTYSSTITSFLSIPTVKDPFETLDELISNKYIPIVINGTNFHEEFEDAKVGPMKNAWQVMQQHKYISFARDNKEGIENIYKYKAGFLTSLRDAYPFIKNNCSFKFAPEMTSFFYSHLGFRKQFPYKKQFNLIMLQMREVGFLRKINDMYLVPNWNPCVEELTVRPVSLYQTIGPIIVFCTGLLISVLIAICEI